MALPNNLPAHSYDIWGSANDPINLVVIGSNAKIRAAFAKAGWVKTGIIHPVTPMFINHRRHQLAFCKPVGLPARHHVRWWEIQPNQWVGAASFDAGLKLTYKPLFLTHHIDPNIDAERDLIVSGLQSVGAKLVETVALPGAVKAGRNAFGDPFHTDGQVKVLELA